MKIGITCYPSMGGSGIIATELGIKMAERGHDVHFITSNIPFRIRKPLPNITFHQVEVNQYAVFQYPPYDITLSTKISDVIKRIRFRRFTYALRRTTRGLWHFSKANVWQRCKDHDYTSRHRYYSAWL